MIHIHIRSGIFAAIAICIVLLAYYLSQQSIDLELPVSYLPLQGKPFYNYFTSFQPPSLLSVVTVNCAILAPYFQLCNFSPSFLPFCI
jgi:hypothetical protein